MQIVNPANGNVIKELPEDTGESIHAKYQALRTGQKQWTRVSLTERVLRMSAFADLLRKDAARQKVAVRILLPILEMLCRRNLQRIAGDGRPGMGRRSQPNDLRRQGHQPVISIAGPMIESNADGHANMVGYE